MKLRNLLLTVVTVALIYSCKKEKQEQITEPETITLDMDGLPKPTSSGLNSFGFIENTQPWWGSNEQKVNSVIARKFRGRNKFMQIMLTVQDLPNNYYKYMLIFQLDTAQLATGYTYVLKLSNSSNSWVSVEKLARDPAGNPYLMITSSNNVDPSILTVTKYDPDKRILAGTFSLKTNYFNIMKGRFDLKYDTVL